VTFDERRNAIYPELSWERYVAINRVNVSTLKELARSAKHYRFRLGNEKQSAALSFGRSAHTAILEPARFEATYVVWDEKTESGRTRPRNGKIWDQFCAANSGKVIVKVNEYRFACAVREAVWSKPVARKYLGGKGSTEVSVLWHDAANGRPCKARLDRITNVEGLDVIVGLKTTRDHAARPFANEAAKRLYYLQWAFYYDAYSTIAQSEPRMVEIVVESAPPYDSTAYIIPSEVLERGREEYRELLAKLGECEAQDRWPGIAENEVRFELPAYMNDDEDDEDDAEENLDAGDLDMEATS
jgi:hypothetical protein